MGWNNSWGRYDLLCLCKLSRLMRAISYIHTNKRKDHDWPNEIKVAKWAWITHRRTQVDAWCIYVLRPIAGVSVRRSSESLVRPLAHMLHIPIVKLVCHRSYHVSFLNIIKMENSCSHYYFRNYKTSCQRNHSWCSQCNTDNISPSVRTSVKNVFTSDWLIDWFSCNTTSDITQLNRTI